MQRATNDAPAVFSVILIVSALQAGMGLTAVGAAPAHSEQAIAAIERCMEQTPPPWPDNWRTEYIDTVREAIGADPNSLPAPWHMEALARAFEPYWQALAKDQDRPSFEVQRAEIRWCVENLVRLPAPSEPARQQLHDHYQALWDHAAAALLAQFPFLDQWLIHIHAMTIAAPDHYLQAIRDRNEAQRRHRQALSQAWAAEKRLERQYHGQLLQTEYLSFLFAALLETASQDAGPTQGGNPHGQ